MACKSHEDFDNLLFGFALILWLLGADHARKMMWEYEEAFKEYQEAKLSNNRIHQN